MTSYQIICRERVELLSEWRRSAQQMFQLQLDDPSPRGNTARLVKLVTEWLEVSERDAPWTCPDLDICDWKLTISQVLVEDTWRSESLRPSTLVGTCTDRGPPVQCCS